jgi:hypothetical protein
MRTTLSHLTLNAAIAQQMPESADGGSTSSTATKKRQAKHELVKADGALVADNEGEPEAHGIRYTLLAMPDKAFTYIYGQNPDADRMLACFGAKTLCTNETSAARNSDKGEASPAEQMDAVVDRFALLATGQWVDRTGGVGAKVDLDALAEAICQQLIEDQKATAEQIAQGYKAKVRAKLDDDKVYARKSRTHNGVAAKYAAIVGRSTATTDDLMIA